MSSVIVPSFGNSTGCLQPSFKDDLRNLHPTQSTPSSSKKGSNWEIFECPFSLLSLSLLQSLGLKNLISAANFLAWTIFMTSISASWSKLLLIISPWLSFFRIFFKSYLYLSTIATTLFILYQEDILISRASRMPFPVEMQLIWRHLFISGSSCKIFPLLSWMFHSASGFHRNDRQQLVDSNWFFQFDKPQVACQIITTVTCIWKMMDANFLYSAKLWWFEASTNMEIFSRFNWLLHFF